MLTISAESSFNVCDEKKFAKLMSRLVPEWDRYLANDSPISYSPEEREEVAIRQATAQVAREHPEVLEFRVMCSRTIHRSGRSYYTDNSRGNENFRAMFAEV